MQPDPIAALRRLGYIGPRPGDWEVPQRKRKSYSIWAPPPRTIRAPLLGVTQDATSNVYIPQNSSEWTTFNAANGWANPDHLYLCQEASGAIVDKIGSSNLANAGSPTYANAVTGWSTKSINLPNNSTTSRFSSTAITNISTTSCTVLSYFINIAKANIAAFYLLLGTTTVAGLVETTAPAYRTSSGANNAIDTNAIAAGVTCQVLKVDRTNNVVKGYITAAASILTPTFSSSMTGNQLIYGSTAGNSVPSVGLLYMAVWVGSNAEKTDQDIKSLMMQLGNNFWNPSWTEAYTAALSETDSESESVSVVVSDVVGISETDSETESIAAAWTSITGVSESESIAETLDTTAGDAGGLASTVSFAEQLDSLYSAVASTAESASSGESGSGTMTAAPSLTEADAEAEQLGTAASDVVAIAESESVAEALSQVKYSAQPALNSQVQTLDQLLAVYTAAPLLSSTLNFTERLGAGPPVPTGDLASSWSEANPYAGSWVDESWLGVFLSLLVAPALPSPLPVGHMTNLQVFDVTAYGATGNGTTDDTTAIRNAEAAVEAAGGGVLYFPRTGAAAGGATIYLISEHASTFRCIEMGSRVIALGQDRGVTVKLAGGQRSFVRMFYFKSGTVDAALLNIHLDGNRPNQPDQTGLNHNDVIFLDTTSRVLIRDVEVGFAAASACVVWQNSVDTKIDHCYFHDCGWMGVVLGDAGGQQRLRVRDCYLPNNAAGFHIEVSNGCNDISFEGGYVNASSAGSPALSIAGGTGSTNWATNIGIRDVKVDGFVQIASAANITLDSVTINNNDNSSGNSPLHYGALRILGSVNNITATKCTVIHNAGTSAPHAVIIAGDTNNALTGVRLIDCEIQVLNPAADGVRIQQAASVLIKGGKIVGTATQQTGFYGINVYASLLPNNGTVRIKGVHVVDFQYAVAGQSVTIIKTNNLEVSGCTFEAKTPGIMTSGMSLDLDARHSVLACITYGHELIGISSLFATYPNVPMLIGGARGGVGIYSVSSSPAVGMSAGAPNFTAPVGSIAIDRTAAAGSIGWMNKDGTGSGWQKVNLT